MELICVNFGLPLVTAASCRRLVAGARTRRRALSLTTFFWPAFLVFLVFLAFLAFFGLPPVTAVTAAAVVAGACRPFLVFLACTCLAFFGLPPVTATAAAVVARACRPPSWLFVFVKRTCHYVFKYVKCLHFQLEAVLIFAMLIFAMLIFACKHEFNQTVWLGWRGCKLFVRLLHGCRQLHSGDSGGKRLALGGGAGARVNRLGALSVTSFWRQFFFQRRWPGLAPVAE